MKTGMHHSALTREGEHHQRLQQNFEFAAADRQPDTCLHKWYAGDAWACQMLTLNDLMTCAEPALQGSTSMLTSFCLAVYLCLCPGPPPSPLHMQALAPPAPPRERMHVQNCQTIISTRPNDCNLCKFTQPMHGAFWIIQILVLLSMYSN